MLNTPFAPWPSYDEDEVEIVESILRSNQVNYWTGQQGLKFEEEFATWVNCRKAIAVSNGSAALDLAWRALGLGEGDEVIVTSRTFLASASSIVLTGATPIFADVEPESQNVSIRTIEPLITDRTKAIVCVHLAGWPCEMNDIIEVATRKNIAVVEDCAQAHGALYRDQSVGTFGDIGCWSFCQDKIMTTAGEGGMITTNNVEYWSAMWSFKDHGKSWNSMFNRDHPVGFRWHHEKFGTNFRLPEIQSAIGRLQLKKMTEWTSLRTRNANLIRRAATAVDGLRVPVIPEHIKHAHYKTYVFVRPEALKSNWSRDRIIEEIVSRGVPCYSGSCSEIYLEKCFKDAGLQPKQRLPVAKELGETSLMFLVHPTLREDEVVKTIEVLTEVMKIAAR